MDIPTSTIIEINDLMYAMCIYAAKNLELRQVKEGQ